MEEEEIRVLAFALKLGIKPFPYQIDFLTDNSKRIIWVAGRQVGKTTMTAIKGLYFALSNDNSVVLVVAPTWRQSSLLFNKMQNFIIKSFLINYIENMTKTMIKFSNGSEIYSLPAGSYGDTIRGFSADLIIFDEGAYIPEEVYIAVEPALATKNGTLILIGTPAGKTGRFYEAWISDHWSKHHTKTEENPMISEGFLEEKRAEMTELQFRKEFMGEFLEEEGVFIPMNLILKSATCDPKPMPEEGYDYILGVDIARLGTDETAYVIVRTKDYERFEMIYYETQAKSYLTEVVGRIKALNKVWKFAKIIVDSTGLGAGVLDSLKEAGLIVEGFEFNSNQRAELYQNLKLHFEKGTIKILNDRKVINQLNSYTYEYKSDGRLKIIKTIKGHDDISDALALALYGSRTGQIYISKARIW